MQKTLPANFNQWDDAPPKTLPANFDQWDDAPAPKPKTIEEEAAAAGGLPVAAPSAPKVQMKEEYVPGLAKPYLLGVDAAAAADKSLAEKADDSAVAKASKAVGRSAMKTGRALTEPKNLAIAGGLAAVNAAQLIPGSQPITIPLAQAANATAATYFGAEMASALPAQYGEYSKAVGRGDVGGAVESLTDMGTAAAMSAGGARGAVELSRVPMAKRMGVAKPEVASTPQPAPPPVVTPERRSRRKQAQGGAVLFPGLSPQKAATPGEAYADKMIAQREAARETGLKRGVEAMKDTVAKVKAEAVDSLSPILDAVDKAQKEYQFSVRPEHRFEYWADRSLGSREMSERFMRDNGLLDIIKAPESRKELDRFDQYLIAKEALREAENQGRDTGRDLTADREYVDEFRDRPVDAKSGLTHDQLAQQFYAYGGKLLDYSVESGLISPETAAEWRTQYKGEHVPLSRVFNAIESASGQHPAMGKQVASLGKQTVFNKRKGSVREIDNPMYELMERTRAAVSQGERNQAARVLAGYAELPGLSSLIKEVDPGASVPKHSFSYLDGGKRRIFETTPEIEAAAKTLDSRNLGLLAQIIGVPARVARFFTTGVRPAFAVANVPVDLMTTAVVSKNAANTTANPIVFMKALVAATKHNGDWSKIENHGAGFTQLDLYRNTREHTIDAIRAGKSMKEKGRYIASHPIRSTVELFRAAEDLISRSEQFGRARTFMGTEKAELAKGHTQADAEILAAIASNNELPNYKRSGNVTRALNGAVMYLNAGVQGSRNLVRALKDRPIETSAKIAAAVYMPVAMATLYNLSDPERKKIYDDIREYEKDNNLILVTPSARPNKKTNKYEGIIKVKLAPGLSNLSVSMRRLVEQFYGADPMTGAELAQKLTGAVLPFEPSVRGVMAGGIPQVAKPPIQAVTNYDFFRGGPKVPKRLQDLPEEQQVLPNTSGTVKRLANAIGTSPIATEEFIKDSIGGAAPELINAVDSAAASLGAIPKEEVGGQGVGQSMTARFDEARSGEMEQKEYEALDKIRDKAVSMAVKRIMQDPRYAAITDEKQRLDINRKVASRVMAKIGAMTTQSKSWDAADHARRMAALKKLDLLLGGKRVFGN